MKAAQKRATRETWVKRYSAAIKTIAARGGPPPPPPPPPPPGGGGPVPKVCENKMVTQ